MHAHVALGADAPLDQGFIHGLALIALQLDYIPERSVLDDGSVGVEVLLERPEDAGVVRIRCEPLDGRPVLATSPCLDANVNV